MPFNALAEAAMGLSYAELRRAVDEAIKEALMHDEPKVSTDALKAALVERKNLNQRLNNKNSQPHAGPAAI